MIAALVQQLTDVRVRVAPGVPLPFPQVAAVPLKKLEKAKGHATSNCSILESFLSRPTTARLCHWLLLSTEWPEKYSLGSWAYNCLQQKSEFSS